MLYLPAAFLFLYLFFRLVLPSGLSRAGKAAAGAALFVWRTPPARRGVLKSLQLCPCQ